MPLKSVHLGPAALLAVSFCAAQTPAIDPSRMPRIGTVDERFQSYNVEMVEVTGGRFWAPYKKKGDEPKPAAGASSIPGLDPSLFRMREPVDLRNARLRKLAAALGPAYLRVSGTWANSTYFTEGDEAPAKVPAGFGGALTGKQWRGVIDFARAADARLVTSFAISPGVRDAAGVWTPEQARKWVAFTKANGGSIAAAEFFNEPSFAGIGGAPKGYTAANYGRDFQRFRAFAREAAPGMLIVGPGSLGEASGMGSNLLTLKTAEILAASDGGLDGFSYHFYGAASKRCSAPGMNLPQNSPESALSDAWLANTDRDLKFYAALRDRFAPAKPIWLTETAETACGGNALASTFADSFRYLDQLGRLAKQGVQVVAHNTLSASDYGLIDEETLTPRPNYWAALLWRRLMGTTVLDAGASAPGVHLYSHCLRGQPGGVALLAINLDRGAAGKLSVPAGEHYTLTAEQLESGSVQLNGRDLQLGSGDALPKIAGAAMKAGTASLPPASITFFTFPKAANAACR